MSRQWPQTSASLHYETQFKFVKGKIGMIDYGSVSSCSKVLFYLIISTVNSNRVWYLLPRF